MRGPEYVTGEAFCYLGRRYRLKIVELQKQPLQFDGSRFAEAKCIQFQIGDASALDAAWTLDALIARVNQDGVI